MKHNNLSEALKILREHQKKAFEDLPDIFNRQNQNNTEQSVNCLHLQRPCVPTENPFTVRRGPFKYNRKTEEERIKRAEDIIKRIQPGPYEDPNYFALLAYQAASIEMVVPKDAQEQFQRIIFGTVHNPVVNALATSSKAAGFTRIEFHSAIIDFVYQAAKAVVEVLYATRTQNGFSAVSSDTSHEVIFENLRDNLGPTFRLYKTLEKYFYFGYPRAFQNESIKDEHGPALSILVSLAERWIIAHEYGHHFAMGRNFHLAPNPHWAEEYFSDSNATIFNVLSAYELDHISPEFALAAGHFVLTCLEILQKTESILKNGFETDDIDPFHPPTRERAIQIINHFRQFFDVNYNNNKMLPDLKFIAREEPPSNHPFGEELSKRVFIYSNILNLIWPQVMNLLEEQNPSKRKLHSIWL
jgi:hypothetical protein